MLRHLNPKSSEPTEPKFHIPANHAPGVRQQRILNKKNQSGSELQTLIKVLKSSSYNPQQSARSPTYTHSNNSSVQNETQNTKEMFADLRSEIVNIKSQMHSMIHKTTRERKRSEVERTYWTSQQHYIPVNCSKQKSTKGYLREQHSHKLVSAEISDQKSIVPDYPQNDLNSPKPNQTPQKLSSTQCEKCRDMENLRQQIKILQKQNEQLTTQNKQQLQIHEQQVRILKHQVIKSQQHYIELEKQHQQQIQSLERYLKQEINGLKKQLENWKERSQKNSYTTNCELLNTLEADKKGYKGNKHTPTQKRHIGYDHAREQLHLKTRLCHQYRSTILQLNQSIMLSQARKLQQRLCVGRSDSQFLF